jgi:hypothetical protein
LYDKPGFDEEERNNWREAKVLGFDSLLRFEIFATTRTMTERCGATFLVNVGLLGWLLWEVH